MQVNFPNPPAGQPHWLALAQGVFNSQAPRWDTASCDGGLKWQISPLNNGYNYKNAISNGCFFNMAARLGLYTGNTSYFDWAEKTWDWVAGPVGLINNQSYVFDGSDDAMDCAEVSHLQWSYNAGVFLYGAAVMWNATEGDTQVKWETRTRGLLTGIVPVFFNNQTMIEIACERGGNCNIDQQTFKAYLARWMAASVKVAPWTHDTIVRPGKVLCWSFAYAAHLDAPDQNFGVGCCEIGKNMASSHFLHRHARLLLRPADHIRCSALAATTDGHAALTGYQESGMALLA
jgi:mannan endo-1,6-alpha-mannosidase